MESYDRLCRAVLELVAEQGLAAVTVGALIARAGVTREDFYGCFPSRFECYAAALRGDRCAPVTP